MPSFSKYGHGLVMPPLSRTHGLCLLFESMAMGWTCPHSPGFMVYAFCLEVWPWAGHAHTLQDSWSMPSFSKYGHGLVMPPLSRTHGLCLLFESMAMGWSCPHSPGLMVYAFFLKVWPWAGHAPTLQDSWSMPS